MKTVVAKKADEQRNKVVFDIFPKEHGFKEVFPGVKMCENSILGESFKSQKMWKMLKGFKGAAYLTILTREFLLEDLLSKEGKRRIDDNPVNSKTYNVFVFRPVLTTSHTHLYLNTRASSIPIN